LIPEELKAHHGGLGALIDYGTFDFLGRAVQAVVRWIHGAVGSYGLSLIFLAMLLRLLLFPVTQFNLKSLRELPRLLQQMDAIEDEEEEDPERAAVRLQPLRKRQVLAMIGSFAPLVIQIPVFLALYQVLNTSIALRNAGFGPWITDLSMRDPLFLLPLLMGAAMIVQQRLTVANPKENRTWFWMPAGFALLFSFFPAGLVLFWLADSVLSVAQLAWIACREPGR
jgi:YidC/Oxa1 family membrane protein insertase